MAGAAIGASAGFLGGGISGVVSGGGLAGFANGALLGTVTGAISGAVGAWTGNIAVQMGVNAILSAGSYMAGQAISGEKITWGGLLLNAGLGAGIGFFAGPGWNSVAMGSKLLLKDVALNISKNFLRHTITFLGIPGIIKLFSVNVIAGLVSGLFN